MRVFAVLFLLSSSQSRAFSLPTGHVDAQNFNTTSSSPPTVTEKQKKPAGIVRVNQTSPGEHRLPYVAVAVGLELEKTGKIGSLRDGTGAGPRATLGTLPTHSYSQPTGPMERGSNLKGSYIATVSYGPNSPSLVYTCYTNSDVEASNILNLPNAVQGPYGYVCTVVKGRPGVVTEVQVQEPVIVQGAVELPAETAIPQEPPASSAALNVTQGNVYLNPQSPTQNQQVYYL